MPRQPVKRPLMRLESKKRRTTPTYSGRRPSPDAMLGIYTKAKKTNLPKGAARLDAVKSALSAKRGQRKELMKTSPEVRGVIRGGDVWNAAMAKKSAAKQTPTQTPKSYTKKTTTSMPSGWHPPMAAPQKQGIKSGVNTGSWHPPMVAMYNQGMKAYNARQSAKETVNKMFPTPKPQTQSYAPQTPIQKKFSGDTFRQSQNKLYSAKPVMGGLKPKK